MFSFDCFKLCDNLLQENSRDPPSAGKFYNSFSPSRHPSIVLSFSLAVNVEIVCASSVIDAGLCYTLQVRHLDVVVFVSLLLPRQMENDCFDVVVIRPPKLFNWRKAFGMCDWQLCMRIHSAVEAYMRPH